MSDLDSNDLPDFRFARDGCQKKSSISSPDTQSPLLTAGVRSLGSLERPSSEKTNHPIERMGVETKSTRQNQTNTMPSARGHAQIDAQPMVTRKSILDASLGVSVPLWFLLGERR